MFCGLDCILAKKCILGKCYLAITLKRHETFSCCWERDYGRILEKASQSLPIKIELKGKSLRSFQPSLSLCSVTLHPVLQLKPRHVCGLSECSYHDLVSL